jgi:hypothetical protein
MPEFDFTFINKGNIAEYTNILVLFVISAVNIFYIFLDFISKTKLFETSLLKPV